MTRSLVFGGMLLSWLPWAAPAAEEPKSSACLLGQPRTEYQLRRERLMKEILKREDQDSSEPGSRPGMRGPSEPIIVLVGRDEAPINVMIEGKFRQKNAFVYLTGVEAASAALILQPAQGCATLYLPPADASHRTLEPTPDGPGAAAAEKYGFANVLSTEQFLADLFRLIGDPRSPGAPRKRHTVVYTEMAGKGLLRLTGDDGFVKLIREGAPDTELRDLAPILAELRKKKSDAELRLLRRAIAITGEAQAEVIGSIRPGRRENELEAGIVEAFTRAGAQRSGFPAIVGSGPNSTIPHYFANTRTMAAGDLVVVDIGAEFDYYTADITRTYPASGHFTTRQRAIYELVLATQKAVEEHVKPGETTLRELTRWTRDRLKQSTLRAKDADGQEHTMDHFFIHGLGHYLGMDVHDVGDTSKPLQPGEVFTIEPGIYIPSENLGVRLEDDYLVTPQGLEKLSRSIPSDPEDIEHLIAAAQRHKTKGKQGD